MTENTFEELDRSLRYIIDSARNDPSFDNVDAYNCMPDWVLSVLDWGLSTSAVRTMKKLGIKRLDEILDEST